MSNVMTVLGRLLLAAIFVYSGIAKILSFEAVAGMLAGRSFPAPQVVLALVIALEIGGGAMLAFDWQARYAALALAAFTVVAGILFHDFWTRRGGPPAEFTNQINHFLKNLAIAGGLLLLADRPTVNGDTA